ncbi:MAG: DUF3791 domain-containing protein [Clostridiales bacterium]|jgi:tRNA A37 threonylcarbamoyladenosine dehydratase|nr:DUF3791 domain-containing protein [Clostridiales bacterium]
MTERIQFLAYCIEIYKEAKSMKGNEVHALFEKYGVLDYVYDCYDALHTTCREYTIEDIDEFIAVRRNKLKVES